MSRRIVKVIRCDIEDRECRRFVLDKIPKYKSFESLVISLFPSYKGLTSLLLADEDDCLIETDDELCQLFTTGENTIKIYSSVK